MAINFNELPTTRTSLVLPKGFYKATIINAEMKISKNTGNDYLSLTCDLIGTNGETGKYYDMLMESDKELIRYKLSRFIQALHLNLNGTFELRDLCKLIKGKKFVVDLTIDDKAEKPRNTVNVFEHELYYAINEWASLSGAPESAVTTPTPTDEDAPIAAADAEDSDIY